MFITIFCKYIAKKWKALLVCEDLTIIIQMKYKRRLFLALVGKMAEL